MSISENEADGRNPASPWKRFGGYVVAETQMLDLIGELRISEVDSFATPMQFIADATKPVAEGNRSRIDPARLKQIKLLVKANKNRQYRRVMKAIILAIERGPEGTSAAHRTATRIVDLAFHWTREYTLALRQYSAKLRKLWRAAESDE